MMKKSVAVLGTLLALAACSTTPEAGPSPERTWSLAECRIAGKMWWVPESASRKAGCPEPETSSGLETTPEPVR
jgi:hypothetical protein